MHVLSTGLLQQLDVEWVTDTDQDRERMARRAGIERYKIHVCNPPPIKPTPVSWVRDWACRNLLDMGQWMVWLDDNVRKVQCIPQPHYNLAKIEFEGQESSYWRSLYHTEAPAPRVLRLLGELVQVCEKNGTIYGGFAPEDNYFYRAKHWRSPFGYVKTKLAVYKNDGSSWYPFEGCMFEDWYKSAEVVARYGSIVLNNYARPVNTYWEPGGIGSVDERRPCLVSNVKYIMALFPGLVGDNPKIPGHARFLLRTSKQLSQWRRVNGYLGQGEDGE
jgi:hypothetical protein